MGARTWTLRSLAGAAILGCVAANAAAQVQSSPPSGQVLPAGAAPKAVAGKVAAVVNGEEITMAELENVLKRQPPEVMAMTEKDKLAVRRIALATIIDDVLRHQFLHKVSKPVSKGDIDKKMTEMTDMLKSQGKNIDDFFKLTGETPESLRTSIGYQLQWTAYCNAVGTDEVLQKYYAANKDFFDGVMVETSHIVKRLPPDATEQDIAKARQDLQAIRKDIAEGKTDFATAAKSYSQCESAPRGGQIGCIPRKGVVDEPFAKAAFALKVGEVSDVVQTSFGLHLIKVTDRKPGKPSEFSAVKEKVRMMYSDELDESILMEMRKTAQIKSMIE
jgi:parvulin-like peptidyl-prolyl isomerase